MKEHPTAVSTALVYVVSLDKMQEETKTHENIPASVLKHTADPIPSTFKRQKIGTMKIKQNPKYIFKSGSLEL